MAWTLKISKAIDSPLPTDPGFSCRVTASFMNTSHKLGAWVVKSSTTVIERLELIAKLVVGRPSF
jgi:hypothetical protein